MNQNSIATVTAFCLTLLVNGIAIAADSADAIDSIEVRKNVEWVPPGFESLNEPQLTEIDLYYGGDVAAPVFGDVMSESLRLLAIPPDALPDDGSGGLIQAMSQ